MIVSRYVAVIFLFILLPRTSICWRFAAVNLPEDIFIQKFAVWRNRAFLAIPRFQRNETIDNRGTLFETSWPESVFSLVKNSRLLSPVLHNKRAIDECPRSVVELKVDVRGRLWLLEVPDKFGCSARLVIYNLRRNNQLVWWTNLTNVSVKNLRTLVVDSSGKKGYMGDPGDESIIAFMPEKDIWWRIKMSHGPDVPRVFSSNIAISRKDTVLYMTGPKTLHLFSINLENLWNEGNGTSFNDRWHNATVIWHGTKMGASSGLFCDVRDGLHYFMTREKASVRWDTRFPLTAESHSILLQNENCPCISDYVMDMHRYLWGLVNTRCSPKKIYNSTENSLMPRTVRITRFLLY